MKTLRSLLPLLSLLLVFVVGMVLLFRMRLGAGDLYPRYSSHRADPLGTRLLHDSLVQQPGLRVERNLERIEKLGTRPGRTLVMAGMTPQRWAGLGTEAVNSLDAAVRGGGRLVVVFEAAMVYEKAHRLPDMKLRERAPRSVPVETKPADANSGPSVEAPPGKDASKPAKERRAPALDDDDEEEPGSEGQPLEYSPAVFARRVGTLDLIERLWGVQLFGRWIMQTDEGAVRESPAPAEFPERLPWKSCSYFVLSKGSPWTVLYTRGTLPVLVEMRHGAATRRSRRHPPWAF